MECAFLVDLRTRQQGLKTKRSRLRRTWRLFITLKKSTIDTTKRSDWQSFPFTDFHTKQCALVHWVLDPFNDPRPGYKPYLHFTVTFGTAHDEIVKLTSEAQISRPALPISERFVGHVEAIQVDA